MIEITVINKDVIETAVREKYRQITLRLIEKKISITTMESCTSGLIASLLTDTEGSSAIIKGAYVTYANEAKIKNGVSEEIIRTFGVYSKETALAMAKACKDSYQADIGIGVTGSFGNVDPNNPDSVPGEVYFAIADKTEAEAYHCMIPPQISRLYYKLFMADLIADKLIEKIEQL